MTKKFFLCTVATIVMMVFAPSIVWAAQQSRTLQVGNVYEFVGIDPRVISHVRVTGTGRYQIVARDTDGEVTRFGYAAGQFSINGAGAVEISPLEPLTISFDTARLQLTSRSGFALHEIAVGNHGVVIENIHSEALHVRTTNLTYLDFVTTNRIGTVVHFERGIRSPQLNITAGGSLTVSSEEGTSIYFPSRWHGRQLNVYAHTTPALVEIAMLPNHSQMIEVLTDVTFVPRFYTGDEYSPFAYEYIIRGRDGHVISHDEVEGFELRLTARQAMTITPLSYAIMYFPYHWLEYLDIDDSADTPAYLVLPFGMSMEITNDDMVRPHTVFLRCVNDENVFGFEYVMLYDDEITFNKVEDVITPQASVVVPAGAIVTITSTQVDIAVSIPDISAMDVTQVSTAPLHRQVMTQGTSVFAQNSGDDSATFLFYAQADDVTLDYVLYDNDGDILSFGRINAGDYFTLEEGQSARFTSPDDSATLVFPRTLDGLTVETSSETALYRHMLSYGNILQIDNIDRNRYNRPFLIQNEAINGDFYYDFVMGTTATQMVVLDYGVGTSEQYLLPATRRMTLMPQEGVALSIAFPSSWNNTYLSIQETTEAPLHRITLTPGRTVTLHNNTRNNFVLSNNSHDTHAGFHTYGSGEWVRHYENVLVNHGVMINPGDFFPPGWSEILGQYVEFEDLLRPIPVQPRYERVARYEYVPHPAVNIRADVPQSGDIFLPAGERLRITAALGEDLEIIMPRSWARQLRLLS
ncbi:MAG: hypothetical protein FWE05_09310 [Defluviitaleaceae bacterium]|nr:hypothetical protein [Defluviitaleaceae bacterium]